MKANMKKLMNEQMHDLKEWCESNLLIKDITLHLLHSDASPRVYYRITKEDKHWVLMDSSKERSSFKPFIDTAHIWVKAGILVPQIIVADHAKGLGILSDFGDDLLLGLLSERNVEAFYQQAMDTIVQIQSIKNSVPHYMPPKFDKEHLALELSYFKEWFLEKLLDIPYDDTWEQIFSPIESEIQRVFLEQPHSVLHRDFHSRNLMVISESRLGVIDFQDAMFGPITYDLISLLKDCYVSWNENKILRWQKYFYDRLHQEGYNLPASIIFNRWCDWTALQRHLKVLGIFSRLHLRDNKPRYLQDIPRILTYINRMSRKYPELSDFEEGLSSVIVPKFELLLKQNTDFGSKKEIVCEQ